MVRLCASDSCAHTAAFLPIHCCSSIGAVRGAVCGQEIPRDGGQASGGRQVSRSLVRHERKGCLVVEASDPKQVLELVTEWSEFMQIEATPAIEDQEAGEVLGKLFG
jgi:Domain of unknown function (DUF3303)